MRPILDGPKRNPCAMPFFLPRVDAERHDLETSHGIEFFLKFPSVADRVAAGTIAVAEAQAAMDTDFIDKFVKRNDRGNESLLVQKERYILKGHALHRPSQFWTVSPCYNEIAAQSRGCGRKTKYEVYQEQCIAICHRYNVRRGTRNCVVFRGNGA